MGSFAKNTAKASGQSETKVKRDATRAKKLGEDILAKIGGTSLDKGDELDELDALAKLPKDQQHKLADRAKAGEQVSAKVRPLDESAEESGERRKRENAEPTKTTPRQMPVMTPISRPMPKTTQMPMMTLKLMPRRFRKLPNRRTATSRYPLKTYRRSAPMRWSSLRSPATSTCRRWTR